MRVEAVLDAQDGDHASAMDHLLRVVALGHVGQDDLLLRPEFHAMHMREDYRSLMTEVFGRDIFTRIAGSLAARLATAPEASSEHVGDLRKLVAAGGGGAEAVAALNSIDSRSQTTRVFEEWRGLLAVARSYPRFALVLPAAGASPPSFDSVGLEKMRPEQRAALATQASALTNEFLISNHRRLPAVLVLLVDLPPDRVAAGVRQGAAVIARRNRDVVRADPRLLNHAARNGNDWMCRLLLAAGADPNAPDRDNYWRNIEYPLISAIEAQSPTTVEVLLEAGARVDAISTAGREREPVTVVAAVGAGSGESANAIRQLIRSKK